ncbi:MAG TPA: hypothetical protein VFQ76_02015 [Longimicrobiaceae bacterium]|nr:hypothetical protein [Longimicrobiaceae bacterium]
MTRTHPRTLALVAALGLGGGWIAPKVEILVGGRRVFHEVYSNVRIGEALDPATFAVPAGG